MGGRGRGSGGEQSWRWGRWCEGPPLRVGARLACGEGFRGRELWYTDEIAQLESGRKLVMRTTAGAFPMETTYTGEAIGEKQTRMTLRNHGETSGCSKMVAHVMAMAMRRAKQQDLAGVKDRPVRG